MKQPMTTEQAKENTFAKSAAPAASANMIVF